MKQNIFVVFVFLLNVIPAFSQNDGIREVQLNPEDYLKSRPSEKLFVHTDKSFYTTGEIIWFKIYKCGDSLNKDAAASKVAYVDLIDHNQVPVLKAKIEMDAMDGDGSLELPLSLNSGYYTLRAYTNWMKNFGPEYFFEKKITLFNPFKNLPYNKDTVVLNSIDLFPEGGELVNGILSQVAFKINRPDGLVSGKGYLLNKNNDTISRFTPFKFGLGSFYFTPEKTQFYKVVFVFDDNHLVSKPLPQILEVGYVMHVDIDNQKVNITVHSNDPSASEIYLIAKNREYIKAAKTNRISEGVSNFSISKSDLGPGISQLTIFTRAKQPVCERLIFIPPQQKEVLTTNVSKQVYVNREKVSLSMSSTTSSRSNLSVSVFQLDSLQKNDEHDIASYVWLESELHGNIGNPRFYLSDASEEVIRAADFLMLTHGWRRIYWHPLLNKSSSIKFLPDTTGQIIACKVTDNNTGYPVKNLDMILSIPQSTYQLFSAITDESGMARFRVNEFFGKGEAVLQALHPNGNYKIEFIDPFSEQHTNQFHEQLIITSDKKKLLENYSVGMQSQHIYSADSIQKLLVPFLRDTFPFFGRPQNFYLLDKYTRFTTMEEVLREYVREINVGVKGKGNLKFKLLNENNHGFYSEDILVMVDGIPIPDPDKIFSINPLSVRRIDIIPRSYILGHSFFYGLVNFCTYQENHDGIDIDPKAIVMDYDGLQIKREFYSPDYSSQERLKSRIPDFRNTLYWSSHVQVHQQVQFYTGDKKGRFLVVIQGINNEGVPMSSFSEFEVK